MVVTDMIYAVNKQTKEHRVATRDLALPWADWEFLEADADGWIPWQGGKCPLPLDQPCECKTESGDPIKFSAAGAVIGWEKAVAYYRPILNDKPEAPAWDGSGLPPVGYKVEALADGDWCEAEWFKRHNGQHAVFFICSRALGWADDIRPIRSDEDKAVEEMVKACPYPGSDCTKVDCRALYRAGYRKQEA